MRDETMRLHVQYITADPDHAELWPKTFTLPPIVKGLPQPVDVGDLIEPAPGSIWRIVQRKWRCASPNDVHLTLWVEPAAHPMRQALPLAMLPPVQLH